MGKGPPAPARCGPPPAPSPPYPLETLSRTAGEGGRRDSGGRGRVLAAINRASPPPHPIPLPRGGRYGMHTSCRGLRGGAISESLRSLGVAEGGGENGGWAGWRRRRWERGGVLVDWVA